LEGLVLKRSVDVVLSGVLLVAALPVLLVAALLIKLDSDGPVIFSQARIGRDFRVFQLFKLRTMRHLSFGAAITIGADPRITTVGRALRRLKVDELPQLWNVLRGDMSLVGPRPVIPELAYEFRRSYERLLLARPGLTDPATVKYCREAELLARMPDPLWYFRTVVTPDKLLISRMYQDRATAMSDLMVLAATLWVLLLPAWRTRLVPDMRRRKAPVLVFRKAPRRNASAPGGDSDSAWTIREGERRDGYGRSMRTPLVGRRFDRCSEEDASDPLRQLP